jgi:hypothetical protein
MSTRYHQRGMTAIGWLLVLGLIAFFALITLRLVPMYLEYSKIVSVLDSLKNEPGIGTHNRTSIINLVSRRFDVNDVRDVSPRLVTVTKDAGMMTIGIKYEHREHLVGNIDVVGVFEKHVEVPIH